MRVAFLTSTQWPSLYDDDRLAADALAQRGASVEPVVWSATDAVALSRFDAVVMRSPWDWYQHREAFRAFLASLHRVTCPVFNAPAVMEAFADKTALPGLAAKGVAIVPTEVLTGAQLHRVPAVLAERGWTRAVLKPAFTANAFGAHRFEAARAAEALAHVQAAPGEAWLLQPFIEGITEGERSFVFFDGVFSHAVRKRPKAGDWRVQHEHGGSSEPEAATPEEVAEAGRMLERAAPGTLYARVDAVPHEGRLHLMELEVVEPELFFRHEPRAPARFADALLRRLG